MFGFLTTIFQNKSILIAINALYHTFFIWFPFLVFILLVDLWVQYRHALFFQSLTFTLLEVKLPRDIFKSPQAVEFFISNLYSTLGEGNWYEKWWKGQVRAWYSLEIVSIDGAVHFFIWTRSGSKKQIESNLYSQFPGIEIYEVDDYTLPIVFDPEKNNIFATEFDLTSKDYFPIKTYIDYGLDKEQEEEYKIDPLTPLIEAMGSLSKGNQAWLQIIIRAHVKEDKDPKTGQMVDMKWKKGAEQEIKDMMEKAKGEKGDDGKILPGTNRGLTDVERDTIKALGRSVSKNGFDVGMRMVYFGNKDVFDMSNVGGLVGGVMHFNSSLNGFKPARGVAAKYKWFPWKDRPIQKINREKQRLLDAYKRRAYFYKPYKKPHFVLNTEELATLFHFPGNVSTTPTFSRIESRKAEAPANIPI